MNPWRAFRQWLHRKGQHRLCREVRVVDHYDMNKQWLAGIDGQAIDVTSLAGSTVYKTVHG
jgi:hypothetical protein